MLVQTIAPEARAIRHAASTTATASSPMSSSRREALRYPPFAHLVRIVFSAEEGAPARAAAAGGRASSCWARCRSGPEQSAVLGPADLFRLRGRERQVLVVKSAERRPAVRAVGEAVAGWLRTGRMPRSASASTWTRSSRCNGATAPILQGMSEDQLGRGTR